MKFFSKLKTEVLTAALLAAVAGPAGAAVPDGSYCKQESTYCLFISPDRYLSLQDSLVKTDEVVRRVELEDWTLLVKDGEGYRFEGYIGVIYGKRSCRYPVTFRVFEQEGKTPSILVRARIPYQLSMRDERCYYTMDEEQDVGIFWRLGNSK